MEIVITNSDIFDCDDENKDRNINNYMNYDDSRIDDTQLTE